ncbi:hypothetical protein FKB34_01870 [Glycocaulis profundi]|nr:hypothetical protein FKB34_01870 [Glycocaulis profundi]
MSGPRYSIIPAGAIEDVIAGLMKDSDLRILNAIGSFTDKRGWTPRGTKQEVLAKRCGFRRQRVNDAVAVLEWLGWVLVDREAGDDKPCRYKVLTDYQGEREPGTPPAITLSEFRAQRQTLKKRSWGSTAHLPDGEGCPQTRTPGESANADTMVSSNADTGESASSRTPGVRAAATAVTTDSNDKPPSPLSGGEPGRPACADPDGRCASGPGRSGEDGGEGHGDGANGVRQSAEADGGGDVREGSARADGGAGDGAPEPSLTPERFRDFIKARAGPDAWRDHFVRCRVADGRLIAPTRSTAWGLWERFGGLLTELGVETIRAEHEQCEVRR